MSKRERSSCSVLLPFVLFFFSKMPNPFPPCHSAFFILRGFSPEVHPGQTAIPFKATGSSHLASYFHIRSGVTDRVYPGSRPECGAAPPVGCARAYGAFCCWAWTWSKPLVSAPLLLALAFICPPFCWVFIVSFLPFKLMGTKELILSAALSIGKALGNHWTSNHLA